MKILVVEDEESICEVLKSYFEREGWDVLTSHNGFDAIEKVEKFNVDMVVLDLMIPGQPGEEVCKAVRKISKVPVLMLTSKSREEDMISGLNLGADDYITKPYRIKEVIARIKALRRRIEMFTDDNKSIYRFNQNRFIVNFESNEVIVDSEVISLTSTEFKILDALVKKPGKVFSRQDLSYIVQGYRYIGDGRTMDAHIKNIRKKIEEDPKNPQYIVTVWGVGYKFQSSEEP